MTLLAVGVAAYLIHGVIAVEWAARNRASISEAEKLMVLTLWPLWLLAHFAYRHGWKSR